ncbi:MAG TPA: VOC family protein [Chloroflexota bacterium]|nr:VOC family protein [Chloroflexota bacterium]
MPDYAPGTPMWVDVSSPDLAKTRAFYDGLFGWESQVVPDPQAGGYTMFFLDGKMVAAAGGTMSPDQHPAWSTYICSQDADATAQAVRENGGQVVAGPMDVLGQGRMAVCSDPTGAFFGVWQPQMHRGAEIVNEPGSFSWSELYTRDPERANEFYRRVFNWGIENSDMPNGMKYTLFQVDGRNIAGGMDMTGMLDESIPPHWLVYFTVENADDAAARTQELGGKVLDGPHPTPMGPMAVIEDPVGAAFAVIQFTGES